MGWGERSGERELGWSMGGGILNCLPLTPHLQTDRGQCVRWKEGLAQAVFPSRSFASWRPWWWMCGAGGECPS